MFSQLGRTFLVIYPLIEGLMICCWDQGLQPWAAYSFPTSHYTATTLALALIISHLDHPNSLLTGFLQISLLRNLGLRNIPAVFIFLKSDGDAATSPLKSFKVPPLLIAQSPSSSVSCSRSPPILPFQRVLYFSFIFSLYNLSVFLLFTEPSPIPFDTVALLFPPCQSCSHLDLCQCLPIKKKKKSHHSHSFFQLWPLSLTHFLSTILLFVSQLRTSVQTLFVAVLWFGFIL